MHCSHLLHKYYGPYSICLSDFFLVHCIGVITMWSVTVVFSLKILFLYCYFTLAEKVTTPDLQGNVLKPRYIPCRKKCPKMGNITLYYLHRGNDLLKQNRFRDSLVDFMAAANASPGNVDILENVAECYLKLGYNYRALDNAESISEREPSCFQGVYYKAKALLGLQRFKEAIQIVTSYMSIDYELKKSVDLTNLLKKLHILEYQQHTGMYDTTKMYFNDFLNEDLADFVGPVEIRNIPGKGRGLIATEDILAGQLLIVNKAFSIVYHEEIEDFEWSGCELLDVVADKLTMEPEHADWFYKSYAGPGMSDFTHVTGNRSEVNYGRIQGILSYTSTLSSYKDVLGVDRKLKGLWILPAYINHNGFDSNSFWVIHGDMKIVRAFKNISKGDEILVSYINLADPIKKRERECRQHGFQCYCSLCLADRNDSKETNDERENILKKIRTSSGNPKKLKIYVDELQKLRPNGSHLNVYAISPLYDIAMDYYSKGQYIEAAESLTKAHEIMKSIAFYAVKTVDYSTVILKSYILMRNKKEILKWVEIIKQDLLRAFGSVGIFKFIEPITFRVLNRRGISFY